MSTEMRIARGLTLPLDAVTQTFGILAVRGSGKTNLAGVLAEAMYDASLPFVVIDPVGVWWGLRSLRSGKPGGLPIPIFGGRHGDVPLEAGGGELLADLIAADRMSCVIDVSDFSEGEKIRFLIAFAERLYRKNRHPLHLFLEEADDYCPQRPFKDQARLLGAWENIVRRGRSRGLGITMITQRSASLNKNVLTQIETLFVLRTTSPQDRKAIEAWVQHQGQSREIMESLPGLANGEAWVWSPAWLKILKRVKIPLRRTFDSGATPTARTKQAPATLATIDLESIRTQMADTIERAKATDPKQLRHEIALLKKALKKAETTDWRVDPKLKEREREIAAVSGDNKRLRASYESLAVKAEKLLESCRKAVSEAEQLVEAAREGLGAPASTILSITTEAPAPIRPAHKTVPFTPANGASPSSRGDGSIPKGERKILIACAQHPVGCTREQLTILSGYKRSSRDAYVSRLRDKGFILAVTDASGITVRLVATIQGTDALGSDYERLPTGDALCEYWLERLPVGEKAILAAAVNVYPDSADRDFLSEQTGYKRSSRDAYIGRLKARQLVKTSPEGVTASEELF